MMPEKHVPHIAIIAAISLLILIGFGAVTFWVLRESGAGIDAATKGALIQTWNNLAVMAAGFWVGSSLSAKIQTKSAPPDDQEPRG